MCRLCLVLVFLRSGQSQSSPVNTCPEQRKRPVTRVFGSLFYVHRWDLLTDSVSGFTPLGCRTSGHRHPRGSSLAGDDGDTVVVKTSGSSMVTRLLQVIGLSGGSGPARGPGVLLVYPCSRSRYTP